MDKHIDPMLMNSEHIIESLELKDFENDIKENIIFVNKNWPTKLMVSEEKIDDNSKETDTCLQAVDTILNNIPKDNIPSEDLKKLPVKLEGVNLIDLYVSHIDKLNNDNLDDIHNDFLKSTNPKTERNINYKDGKTSNDFTKGIIENSDTNKHFLETWNSIYEDFSAKNKYISELYRQGIKDNFENILNEPQVIKYSNMYNLNIDTEISTITKTWDNRLKIESNTTHFFKKPEDILFDNDVLKDIENFKMKSNLGQVGDKILNKNGSKKIKTVDINQNKIDSNISTENIFNVVKNAKLIKSGIPKKADTNIFDKVSTTNNNKNATIILRYDDDGTDDKLLEEGKTENTDTNIVKNYSKIDKALSTNNNKSEIILNSDNNGLDHIPLTKFIRTETNNLELTNVCSGNMELKYADETEKQEFECNNYDYFKEPTVETITDNDNIFELEFNTECLNAEIIEKQKAEPDSDGYNSSDFEFITEAEANTRPNFFDKTNFELSPELNENDLKLPDIGTLFGIHGNQKFINYNENNMEDEMINDYFKSLESNVIIDEFDDSYKENHRIPNEEEYVSMFRNYTSSNLLTYEKKTTQSEVGMKVHVDEAFILMNLIGHEDGTTEEQCREARETQQKILSMYSVENKEIK